MQRLQDEILRKPTTPKGGKWETGRWRGAPRRRALPVPTGRNTAGALQGSGHENPERTERRLRPDSVARLARVCYYMCRGYADSCGRAAGRICFEVATK